MQAIKHRKNLVYSMHITFQAFFVTRLVLEKNGSESRWLGISWRKRRWNIYEFPHSLVRLHVLHVENIFEGMHKVVT
jgi:hypothetical protein